MTPSRLSVALLGSFIATVFLLQWWQAASYPPFVWVMVFTLLACGLAGCVHPMMYRYAPWLVAAVLGIIFALWTVSRTTHIPSPQTIDGHAHGREVAVRGFISEEPDRRPLVTKYVIEATAISEGGSGAWVPVSGHILVTDHALIPTCRYGDDVTVWGELSVPGDIEGFRYDHYLSLSSIYAYIPHGSLSCTVGDRGSWIFSSLYTLKDHVERRIEQLLPEPHASFSEGLITGSRRGIPEHVLRDFTATGLTHIVAISGYNITIIMALIAGLLFWLPLRWRFLPSVAAIAAFTIFVGASASVVRAAIMGTMGLLAISLGRRRDMHLAILWALFLMLLWNPKQLWYDAGFQLSFAAVIGLTELSPILKSFLSYLPNVLGLRESLEATIAAQLTAMPIGILLFGNFPLVAPIANILVAPIIPFAMLFVALAMLVSWISFTLGLALAALGWMCLEWIILVAHALARLPGGSLHVSAVSALAVADYYILLTLVVVLWHRHRGAYQW
jgi:competence protein ComEC